MRYIFTSHLLLLAALFSITLPIASSAQCTRSVNGFLDIDLVRNNPFHAELDATKLDATKESPTLPSASRLLGSVDRDSQGRVRVEYVVRRDNRDPSSNQDQVPEQHLILICDPIGHALIKIDSVKHSARISRVAPPHLLFDSSAPQTPLRSRKPRSFSALDLRIEELGNRTILGLEVRGVRIASTPKPAYANKQTDSTINQEDWCSEDLAAVLLNNTSVVRNNKTVREHHSSLINLARTEPDAALFQIPSGYTVSDEEMKGGIAVRGGS
jgi:hypothetical protein